MGGGTYWKQLSVGYLNVLALDTYGQAWGWGGGPVGNGTSSSYSSPVICTTGIYWKQVAAGQGGAFLQDGSNFNT
jgi:hypothetical protein